MTDTDAHNRRVRRPAFISELAQSTGTDADRINGVVNRFREDGRSFLVAYRDDVKRDVLVDISHESLIRKWERLGKWVESEARAARFFLRLAEDAREYIEEHGSLRKGARLAATEEWLREFKPSEGWARRYHSGYDQAITFVQTSIETREKEKRERTKARRRKRWSILGFGAAVVIVAGLGVFAWRQATANRNTRARAERLEEQSDSVAAALLQEQQARLSAEQARVTSETQTAAERARVDSLLREQIDASDLQLTAGRLERPTDLATALRRAYPELAASNWGVTEVLNEGTGTSILYFLLPLSFSNTLISDHQDVRRLADSVDYLLNRLGTPEPSTTSNPSGAVNSSAFGYAFRDGRCEGIINRPVSLRRYSQQTLCERSLAAGIGSRHAIVSSFVKGALTHQGSLGFGDTVGVFGDFTTETRTRLQVNTVAAGDRKPSYQMDVEQPAGVSSYRWPSDLLKVSAVDPQDLGILLSTTVAALQRDYTVLIPATLSQSVQNVRGLGYELTVVPIRTLTEVYVTIARADSVGFRRRGGEAIRDREPLPYARYPTGYPIPITIGNLPEAGLYYLRIDFELEETRGGSSAVELWFYHVVDNASARVPVGVSYELSESLASAKDDLDKAMAMVVKIESYSDPVTPEVGAGLIFGIHDRGLNIVTAGHVVLSGASLHRPPDSVLVYFWSPNRTGSCVVHDRMKHNCLHLICPVILPS